MPCPTCDDTGVVGPHDEPCPSCQDKRRARKIKKPPKLPIKPKHPIVLKVGKFINPTDVPLCKACGGSGMEDDGFEKTGRSCPVCKGSGCGKLAVPTQVKCAACKGEGKVHWKPANDQEDMWFRYTTHAGYRREDWLEDCKACGGKGTVDAPELKTPGCAEKPT